MTAFIIDETGATSTALDLDETQPLSVVVDLHSSLGVGVALGISFFAKVKEPTQPSHIAMALKWVDTATDDVILELKGNLVQDEEDFSSFLSVALSSDEVKDIQIHLGADWLNAVKTSTGFNASNSLGRSIINLSLEEDSVGAFDADRLYRILTTLEDKPSYLVLPQVSDLEVYTTVYRSMDKLNIPLDAELDPTLNVDQVANLATSLSAQDHRVQLIWSPNVCRPRDATSLRGRKVPAYSIGQYIGKKLLRNGNTSAQGIPKIADPVAGESYPFNFKAFEPRSDVVLDEEALEKLAVAKVNVVRRITYSSGAKVVLSDVLTQYDSKNSALRLVNAAEITTYTTNRVIEILRKHMLSRMSAYLTNASRDIEAFLSACSSDSVGLLQPAEDLGGVPYTFTLEPDEQYPFERVRLYLARRPEGATRSAIFDDVINK